MPLKIALTEKEQADLRWYLEDYLQRADVAQAVTVAQIEERMKSRGEELYTKVLAANGDTQALWFAIRNDLAPIHNALGALYAEVGQVDNAREHFEQCAQYEEKTDNHFGAGRTRFNMAVIYAQAAEREDQPSQQRASLLRARAYAEAALRDYQHFQGRAVQEEAMTQGLLDDINQALVKLP